MTSDAVFLARLEVEAQTPRKWQAQDVAILHACPYRQSFAPHRFRFRPFALFLKFSSETAQCLKGGRMVARNILRCIERTAFSTARMPVFASVSSSLPREFRVIATSGCEPPRAFPASALPLLPTFRLLKLLEGAYRPGEIMERCRHRWIFRTVEIATHLENLARCFFCFGPLPAISRSYKDCGAHRPLRTVVSTDFPADSQRFPSHRLRLRNFTFFPIYRR